MKSSIFCSIVFFYSDIQILSESKITKLLKTCRELKPEF